MKFRIIKSKISRGQVHQRRLFISIRSLFMLTLISLIGSCKTESGNDVSDLEKISKTNLKGHFKTEIYSIPVIDGLAYCFAYDVSAGIGSLSISNNAPVVSTPLYFSDFLAGYISVKQLNRQRKINTAAGWSIFNTLQMIGAVRSLAAYYATRAPAIGSRFRSLPNWQKIVEIASDPKLLSNVMGRSMNVERALAPVSVGKKFRGVAVKGIVETTAFALSHSVVSHLIPKEGGYTLKGLPAIGDVIDMIEAIKSTINIENVYRDWHDLTSSATKTVNDEQYYFLREVLRMADSTKAQYMNSRIDVPGVTNLDCKSATVD